MKELSTGFPFQLIHPSYASTIPNSLPAYVKEILIKAHLLAQVRLAEVINRKGGISSKQPSFYATRCHQFCVMSMSKQNIPETDRLKLQIQWKIIDASNQPSVSVTAAAARYDQDKGDGLTYTRGGGRFSRGHLPVVLQQLRTGLLLLRTGL